MFGFVALLQQQPPTPLWHPHNRARHPVLPTQPCGPPTPPTYGLVCPECEVGPQLIVVDEHRSCASILGMQRLLAEVAGACSAGGGGGRK